MGVCVSFFTTQTKSFHAKTGSASFYKVHFKIAKVQEQCKLEAYNISLTVFTKTELNTGWKKKHNLISFVTRLQQPKFAHT